MVTTGPKATKPKILKDIFEPSKLDECIKALVFREKGASVDFFYWDANNINFDWYDLNIRLRIKNEQAFQEAIEALSQFGNVRPIIDKYTVKMEDLLWD